MGLKILADRKQISLWSKFKVWSKRLSFLLGTIALFSPLTLGIEKTLANGLQLVVEQNDYSQTTAVFILINGGKLADPPGKAGLGYLVTRLSLDPPDSEFLKSLMKCGADLKIASKGDFLQISIECLSSDFEDTMKLIYRTFSQPIFSSLRVGHLKEVLKGYQKKEIDDVDTQAELAFLQAFFGLSGYGASSYGTTTTVESFKTEEATHYHRQYFVGSNIIMSVVSALAPERVISIIESTFGRLPRGESFKLTAPSPYLPEKKEIQLTKKSASVLLAAAFPLPAISTENYLLARLLEAIFSQGPGSKMWPLRAESGLAYETGCRLNLMRGGGLLILYLKTMADKYSEAQEKFSQKLKEIVDQGITEDDFVRARQVYRLSFYQQLESKSKRAELLAWQKAFGLEKIETSLEKLTFASLEKFFQQIFSMEKAVFLKIIPP